MLCFARMIYTKTHRAPTNWVQEGIEGSLSDLEISLAILANASIEDLVQQLFLCYCYLHNFLAVWKMCNMVSDESLLSWWSLSCSGRIFLKKAVVFITPSLINIYWSGREIQWLTNWHPADNFCICSTNCPYFGQISQRCLFISFRFSGYLLGHFLLIFFLP